MRPLRNLKGSCACVLALAFVLVSRAEDEPGKVKPARLEVEFAEGVMTLNGTRLQLPIERKQLIQLLGKPDREAPLANTILTWDELGVHAYQVPGSEKIRAIQITMNPEEFSFSPKKTFTGTLKVEGAILGPKSTIESINGAIKPKMFVKETIAWKLEYKGSVLFLEAKDSKTPFSSLQFDQKANSK